MTYVQFEVPGEPVGKGRHRTVARKGKGGQSYLANVTPEKTAAYESSVKLFAAQAMAGRAPLEGPLYLVLYCFHARPKSHPKKNPPQWVTKKPDASNTLKAVEDAMNGVVYLDDVQLARVLVERRYDERPRVEIHVGTLANEPPRLHNGVYE